MRINPHIAATGALVLALSAAAPAAAHNGTGSARVVSPNPDQQVVSPQPSSSNSRPAATPEIRPNPDQQTPTPPATAGPVVQPNPDQQPSPSPAATASAPAPTIVRVITPNSGFDWGDAGIGAAAGLGLSLLALGGTIAASQRRASRARRVTAPTI